MICNMKLQWFAFFTLVFIMVVILEFINSAFIFNWWTNDKIQMYEQHAAAKPADTVIILTQMRSGSSVMGEIFNQKRGVSYFYEPLLPFFENTCETLRDDRIEVLRKIASCQFDLEEHYIRGFIASKYTDKYAQYVFYVVTKLKNKAKNSLKIQTGFNRAP